MMHWAEQYIGATWAEDKDCLYWFRRISRERFGRDVPEQFVDHGRLVACAARIMAGDVEETFGYKATATPREGDAVFLSQRRRPHHLGMVVFPCNRLHVLHALEGSGVVCTDELSLRANGWKFRGFWTYAG